MSTNCVGKRSRRAEGPKGRRGSSPCRKTRRATKVPSSRARRPPHLVPAAFPPRPNFTCGGSPRRPTPRKRFFRILTREQVERCMPRHRSGFAILALSLTSVLKVGFPTCISYVAWQRSVEQPKRLSLCDYCEGYKGESQREKSNTQMNFPDPLSIIRYIGNATVIWKNKTILKSFRLTHKLDKFLILNISPVCFGPVGWEGQNPLATPVVYALINNYTKLERLSSFGFQIYLTFQKPGISKCVCLE